MKLIAIVAIIAATLVAYSYGPAQSRKNISHCIDISKALPDSQGAYNVCVEYMKH